ncbi:hypothetical protein OEZ86_013726 [Tetradesmus obliquus]|nr:hypothetical protein OEZ86_013726 [Tetradesmus obliquus]
MRPGLLWLAALLLLAHVFIEPASPAGPVRGLAQAKTLLGKGKEGKGKEGKGNRAPSDRVYLARSPTFATLRINAVFDAAKQAVSMVDATAKFQYCSGPPGTTQAECPDQTGYCTGHFSTWNPCQAWPQYNYPPCGVFLKAPKRQPVSTAGGFDIGLDMLLTKEASCVLRRRSSSRRRLLQPPVLDTTTLDTTSITPLADTTLDTIVTPILDTSGDTTTVPVLGTSGGNTIVYMPGDVPMVGTTGGLDIPVLITPLPGDTMDTPILITPPPPENPEEPAMVDTVAPPEMQTDSTNSGSKPVLEYRGGPCTVNIKNMPTANACASFSGTISTRLGSKVLRSLGAGGVCALEVQGLEA